jgi:sulfur carrier protein ThiS adenylyltransferase
MTATAAQPPEVFDLSERDLRQRELVPPERLAECRALVIGVGAIGRQVAIQLAATGVSEMTLVDDDHVDVVNLAVQGYAQVDLGSTKVGATAEWCQLLNPGLVTHTHCEKFRRSSAKTLDCFDQQAARKLAVFCCVDSIATRAVVWETVKPRAAVYVDGRMSAEVVRVLASDAPMADTSYPATLFAPERAFAGSCTAKSTIYSASIAAGLMLAQFTRWLRRMPVDPDLVLNLLASELTVA